MKKEKGFRSLVEKVGGRKYRGPSSTNPPKPTPTPKIKTTPTPKQEPTPNKPIKLPMQDPTNRLSGSFIPPAPTKPKTYSPGQMAAARAAGTRAGERHKAAQKTNTKNKIDNAIHSIAKSIKPSTPDTTPDTKPDSAGAFVNGKRVGSPKPPQDKAIDRAFAANPINPKTPPVGTDKLSPAQQGKLEGQKIAKDIAARTRRTTRTGMGRGTPAGILPKPEAKPSPGALAQQKARADNEAARVARFKEKGWDLEKGPTAQQQQDFMKSRADADKQRKQDRSSATGLPMDPGGRGGMSLGALSRKMQDPEWVKRNPKRAKWAQSDYGKMAMQGWADRKKALIRQPGETEQGFKDRKASERERGLSTAISRAKADQAAFKDREARGLPGASPRAVDRIKDQQKIHPFAPEGLTFASIRTPEGKKQLQQYHRYLKQSGINVPGLPPTPATEPGRGEMASPTATKAISRRADLTEPKVVPMRSTPAQLARNFANMRRDRLAPGATLEPPSRTTPRDTRIQPTSPFGTLTPPRRDPTQFRDIAGGGLGAAFDSATAAGREAEIARQRKIQQDMATRIRRAQLARQAPLMQQVQQAGDARAKLDPLGVTDTGERGTVDPTKGRGPTPQQRAELGRVQRRKDTLSPLGITDTGERGTVDPTKGRGPTPQETAAQENEIAKEYERLFGKGGKPGRRDLGPVGTGDLETKRQRIERFKAYQRQNMGSRVGGRPMWKESTEIKKELQHKITETKNKKK